MNDLIKRLNDGSHSVDDVTDDDLRQLIIYYATLLRSHSGDNMRDPEVSKRVGPIVINTWHSWPPELFARFTRMVLSNDGNETEKKAFWTRPAETNIKFGIKITVEPVDTTA